MWKPLLAFIPAGLVIGLLAGQASRPEMIMHAERTWPGGGENAGMGFAAAPPALFAASPAEFAAAPAEFAARSYSYRPALDYEQFEWPDQSIVDYTPDEIERAEWRPAAIETLDANAPVDQPRTVRLAAAPRSVEPAAASGTAPPDRAPVPDRASDRAPAEPAKAAYRLPPVPPPLSDVPGDAFDSGSTTDEPAS